MKIFYHIPTGSWPLQEDPYHDFFKRLSWTNTDKESAQVLVLPGGSDIGQWPDRDWEEAILYKEWSDTGKPVIGICRGMQLMLYLTGGDIVKHIPDATDRIMHTSSTGAWKGRSAWHTTRLGLLTNSRHHQGFLTAPADWEVLDSTHDGVIEAVRFKNQFGVQWHPERDEMINTTALNWWTEEVKKIL